MKNNVSDSNRIFVDRPLAKPAVVRGAPSLWSLCKDDADYTEAALRVFLMLCLISSLAIGVTRINGTTAAQESTDYKMTLRVWSSDSLPSARLNVSYR